MGVRARNESAWLLPNDGTRTNQFPPYPCVSSSWRPSRA